MFAGRPAREKRVDVLVEAVERLGDPYRLLLVGARSTTPASEQVIELPYEQDPARLAALLASCDAFVHANDSEPFGLIVLEAMACGLPVVGVAAGGVGESVDAAVGELAAHSNGPEFAEAIEALFAARRARSSVAPPASAPASATAGTLSSSSWPGSTREVSGEPAFARPAPAYALAS